MSEWRLSEQVTEHPADRVEDREGLGVGSSGGMSRAGQGGIKIIVGGPGRFGELFFRKKSR